MKNFFKENFALITGIALPLALVVMFMAAGMVNKVNVTPPQYSGIFAVKYGHISNMPFTISTDGGKLVIRENEDTKDQKYKPPPPILYMFNHKTMRARKIDIDFTNVKNGIVVDPNIDDLNKHKIITGDIAPDGYEFEYIPRSGNGLFGALFGFEGPRRNYYALTKDGKHATIKTTERLYGAKLIGWLDNE